MNKMVSVVIPAYNEEGMIAKTAATISAILTDAAIDYELIFVNDGSRDSTWDRIRKAAGENPAVRGVCFSRNFGKEAAMFAGMYYAKGACCVVIDCDLQHPPEKIVEMYRLWEQGYEIIEAVKTDRGKESFLHTLSARCFYKIISEVTGIDMSRASDFKLLDRKAVNVLLNMKEKNAFFRALSSWIGFRTTQVEFEVRERTVGESKWSTWSLIRYAVSNVTAFSAAPMQIVTVLGILMLCASLVLGVISLYQKFMGTALGGFTTVIIIQLFTGSIIMISLGIIGYYISKIYEEIKGRPRYVVSETCGEEEKKNKGEKKTDEHLEENL
ncbi:MAG TPA: glycosyltransferase family 2 protein [Candidatus Fusicatenibacter merdavium]|uniref:Glycosyltransferase family 2 protein n=1 Tax=Candidatus Fusicatenibacter merdavium TaxID=2838600 RepID=A0A9D1XEY3_9FIRM|nr:glycosyltransferase family 2 protein [Candidatus Fusicatenibacter merdavium]